MDTKNDGSTPGQEEEVFESPQSEEEVEEFDVAEALKDIPGMKKIQRLCFSLPLS